ncbi:hypothetical protein JCM3770_005543 [Rhodotorula araucariae]
MTHGATTTGTAVKRSKQRQALSCAECRRLKLKCDRVFPCSACRKRDCADICPVGTAKPPGRAVRIAAEFGALLRRVDELESIVRELGAAERIPAPLNLEEATKRSTSITKALEAEIERGDRGAGAVGGAQENAAHKEDDLVDAEGEDEEEANEDAVQSVLVGIGSLSIAESGRTRFLGTSAGSAYYYEENGAHDTDSVHSSSLDESLADDITRLPYIQLGTAYPKGSELERLRGYLPDEADGRLLSENYWKYLSFQFTPIEEDVFWNDYLPSAYTSHDPHGTKLAAVFIILSLGCLFDPAAPATPNADAHHYFVLAHNTLAASRFLANSTLAGIQTLQLSANFLLNYHDFHQGAETLWPVLGMASRMLVTQGLHRDGVNFGLTGAELNRRRRVFYELITLERMQSFISGRPYTLQNAHFDTAMPDDADAYQRQKWNIGLLIGKVIDRAFSVATPSYATILALDQELRELVKETPAEWRSGALPADAFVSKPSGIPQLPPLPDEPSEHDLVFRMRAHTLDQMFSQVLFYLHKPAFAQALLKNSDEPLRSPWAASVAAVSLETAVYLLAVAKSWNGLHPICTRWWHIYFHAFAASVAQSSLVIKSPRSMLAPHAWSQLNEAVAIFEAAGASGAPVAAFVPRLRLLRDKAYLSLQNVISVPLGLSSQPPADVADSLAEGTDASLFILGPPTRLERKQRKKQSLSVRGSPAGDGFSPDGASPSTVLAKMLHGAPALSERAPPVAMLAVPGVDETHAYHPLDAPILPRQQSVQLLAPSTTQAIAAQYLAAPLHPAQANLYPPQPFYHLTPPESYHNSAYASPAAAGPSTGPQTTTTQAYARAAAQAAVAQAAAAAAQPGTVGVPYPDTSALYGAHDPNAQQRFAAPTGVAPSQPDPLASFHSALFPGGALGPLSSPAVATGTCAPPPQTASVPAPNPQFTFANFATAFPLQAVGGEVTGAEREAQGTAGQAVARDDRDAQAQGMVDGLDGWAWFDVLGGTGGAPSAPDFGGYTE